MRARLGMVGGLVQKEARAPLRGGIWIGQRLGGKVGTGRGGLLVEFSLGARDGKQQNSILLQAQHMNISMVSMLVIR